MLRASARLVGFAPFVRRIEGDPSAVVGLSLPTLRLQLGRLGVTITDLWQG